MESRASSKELCVTNTPLHKAIIEDASIEAIIGLINQHTINTPSLSNTPLMLALKKGRMDIAEKLLDFPKIGNDLGEYISPGVDLNLEVAVDLADEHGLTPLHWACMLRQDKIITKLAEKGAIFSEVKPWASSYLDEKIMDPITLYQTEIWDENFLQYLLADHSFKGIKKYSELQATYGLKYSHFNDLFFNKNSEYCGGIVDREGFHIPGEMAFTDIVFHLDDLCNHLGFIDKKIKFARLGDSSFTQSKNVFEYNVKVGISLFCNSRNAIPVNPTIIEILERLPKITAINFTY